MRMGIFWLGTDSAEAMLAVRHCAASKWQSPFEGVACYVATSAALRRPAQVFIRQTTRYPYGTINDLVDVFNLARQQELDFAVITFGNAVPLSGLRMAELLQSLGIQRSIWSFRVARITGKGMRHSARLPYVDDHFIVLNVNQAVKRDFFGRELIHASHFDQAGGRHAHLLSMIEYSLRPEEVHNHFDELASRDAYGRLCGLTPISFHLCETTGFVTCYPQFRRSLRRLLQLNVDLHAEVRGAQRWRIKFARQGDYCYFRSLFSVNRLVGGIYRSWIDIGKYEFRKRYDSAK